MNGWIIPQHFQLCNIECQVFCLLGSKGRCSDIQQPSSETDWYTLSYSRLYLPTSWHTICTYDWVGTS